MDAQRIRGLLPDIEDDEFLEVFQMGPAPPLNQEIPVRHVPALEDPPRDPAPALNLQEEEEDVFAQIHVPEVLPQTLFQQQLDGLNAAARAKLREVSIRVQTYAFKEEYMPYLVDLFMGRPHDLLLSNEHHQIMLSRYDLENHAYGAAKKIEVLSHLEAIHEIFASRVFDRVAEIRNIAGSTEDAYQLRVDTIDIYGYNSRVVICIERQLLGTADFKWYTATVTAKNNTTMRLTVPHCDVQPNFAIHDVIRTPSNNAADVVTLKLLEVGIPADHIWRAVAPGVKMDRFDQRVLQCTRSNDRNVFTVLNDIDAKDFPIVVCTMGFAPYLKGVGKKHFTHVYADESGQALDMQSLATFAAFTWTDTRVMIFGDPQQLRPFFADSVIGQQEYNANLTTIERLNINPRYNPVGNVEAEGQWLLRNVLEWNYRSCRCIVESFSQQFYENRVQPAQPYDHTELDIFHNPPALYILEGQRYPMRWHVVRGREKVFHVDNSSSFSYYNNKEVLYVEYYLKRFIDQFGIDTADIGIITPYRAQFVKIKRMIASHGDAWRGILVDTVGKFQGAKRSVIILSTVRTKKIGFLSEYRRLNVAISCPRHLIIVIGDLYLLRQDPHWRRYAQHLNDRMCILDNSVQQIPNENLWITTQNQWRNMLDEV